MVPIYSYHVLSRTGTLSLVTAYLSFLDVCFKSMTRVENGNALEYLTKTFVVWCVIYRLRRTTEQTERWWAPWETRSKWSWQGCSAVRHGSVRGCLWAPPSVMFRSSGRWRSVAVGDLESACLHFSATFSTDHLCGLVHSFCNNLNINDGWFWNVVSFILDVWYEYITLIL